MRPGALSLYRLAVPPQRAGVLREGASDSNGEEVRPAPTRLVPRPVSSSAPARRPPPLPSRKTHRDRLERGGAPEPREALATAGLVERPKAEAVAGLLGERTAIRSTECGRIPQGSSGDGSRRAPPHGGRRRFPRETPPEARSVRPGRHPPVPRLASGAVPPPPSPPPPVSSTPPLHPVTPPAPRAAPLRGGTFSVLKSGTFSLPIDRRFALGPPDRRTPGSRPPPMEGPQGPLRRTPDGERPDREDLPTEGDATEDAPTAPSPEGKLPDGRRPDGGPPDGARPDGGPPDGARPEGEHPHPRRVRPSRRERSDCVEGRPPPAPRSPSSSSHILDPTRERPHRRRVRESPAGVRHPEQECPGPRRARFVAAPRAAVPIEDRLPPRRIRPRSHRGGAGFPVPSAFPARAGLARPVSPAACSHRVTLAVRAVSADAAAFAGAAFPALAAFAGAAFADPVRRCRVRTEPPSASARCLQRTPRRPALRFPVPGRVPAGVVSRATLAGVAFHTASPSPSTRRLPKSPGCPTPPFRRAAIAGDTAFAGRPASTGPRRVRRRHRPARAARIRPPPLLRLRGAPRPRQSRPTGSALRFRRGRRPAVPKTANDTGGFGGAGRSAEASTVLLPERRVPPGLLRPALPPALRGRGAAPGRVSRSDDRRLAARRPVTPVSRRSAGKPSRKRRDRTLPREPPARNACRPPPGGQRRGLARPRTPAALPEPPRHPLTVAPAPRRSRSGRRGGADRPTDLPPGPVRSAPPSDPARPRSSPLSASPSPAFAG